MVPDAKMPAPGSSAEEWNIWWRNWVMEELNRLNEADLTLRKEVATSDRTTAVDIEGLKTQARIYGAEAGTAVGFAIGVVFLILDKFVFK